LKRYLVPTVLVLTIVCSDCLLLCVLYRARSRGDSDGYEQDGRFLEADGTIMRATGLDPSGPGEASSSCSSAGVDNETVILSLRERVRWLEQRLYEKVYGRMRFPRICTSLVQCFCVGRCLFVMFGSE